MLNIDIFADGADLKSIKKLSANPLIKGYTTNPTLMRNAGIKNYKLFAKEVVNIIQNKPVSFEIFADDFDEMFSQANIISTWGKNINVKIPITNTKGVSSGKLVKALTENGIKVNVTALMNLDQLNEIIPFINPKVETFVSIFAGRVADTGVDPVPMMENAVKLINENLPKCKLIWASPREVLNIYQANDVGCHVITATDNILDKLTLRDKDLNLFSLETVKMFYNDALEACFEIKDDK